MNPLPRMQPAASMDDAVFLRPDTKVEPLVCGWYAWAYLIAPVQHAFNLLHRHLPLLDSFLRNPAIHLAAAADPQLYGGQFVDLREEDRTAVETLASDTRERCSRLLRLAQDLKQLDGDLQHSADGYSLSEHYGRIPDSLRGLVEFLYDIDHHARIRVHEDLVYDEDLQATAQEVVLSRTPEGSRPFFMSTPRLSSPETLALRTRFSNSSLDALFAARTRPVAARDLSTTLALSAGEETRLARFLTTEGPRRNNPMYAGEGVRIRYFGHACVLVQSQSTAILMDPMFAWEADKSDGRLTFSDLPDWIDFVVISHAHADHLSPEMLLQIRHRTGCVVVPRNNSGSLSDPSLKLILRQLGFERIHVVDTFDRIPFADGAITSLPFPGEHVDLDIYSRHGVHIEIRGKRIVCLVDSDGWDAQLFRRIAHRIGKRLDALFIGMECQGAPLSWAYGPLLLKPLSRRSDESRRLSGLDSTRAWNVIHEFEASRILVYAMGQEPWLKYLMGLQYSPDSIQLREVARFLGHCREADIRAENLFVSKEIEL